MTPGSFDLVARRTRLDAQVLLLGALALGVAERLVAAGEVLRRPVLPQVLVPGRGLQREVRIGEVRPGERHEVGLAGGEQRVDLVGVVTAPTVMVAMPTSFRTQSAYGAWYMRP